MGFLSSLIKEKKEKAIDYTNNIEIHNDIKNLLWIKDGEKKNYYYENENSVNLSGIIINMREEPSLISISMPVNFEVDLKNVEKVGYFPSYEQLTQDQRGAYWKVLNNPYNKEVEISYIFILYYGLERHLLKGNYEEAFNIILKLRNVHENSSFQNYSANALILTGLIRQRADLVFKFIESLDKEFEYNLSDNLYVFCKNSLSLPISARDIMRMAKSFEFTKLNYIKNYSEIFESTLNNNLLKKYNSKEVVIGDFINKASQKKIKEIEVNVFANMSIIDNKVTVPNIIESFKFKKEIYELLDTTHEEVKIILRKNKKDIGVKPLVKKTSEKKVKNIIFDKKEETILLVEKQRAVNILDKHFALLHLHEFYYTYRELDMKYLEICIKICLEDLSLLYGLQEGYQKENRKYFEGKIVAFNRLAIIYQKQKRIEDVIEVCDTAINYYNAIGEFSKSEEFDVRRLKLK